MRHLLHCLLITLGLSAWPSAVVATAAVKTPFLTRQPGEVVVSVIVNGTGPFLFLLDTGTSRTLISSALGERLGAKPVAKTVLTTATGSDTVLVVGLERLDVGPLSRAGMLASVLPVEALDPSGRIQGILGQDVLASERYTLDFRQRQVIWHDASEPFPRRGTAVKLHPEAGRFLLELPQGEAVLRLVPDSGSNGLVLFRRPGRSLPSIAPLQDRARLTTLTDQRNLQLVFVSEILVGTIALHRVPAVLVDRPAISASDADGLLPLHFFERVTFDGPGRVLVLEEKPPVLLH